MNRRTFIVLGEPLRVDEAARPAAPAYDADRRFIPGPNGPLRLDRGQPYRG